MNLKEFDPKKLQTGEKCAFTLYSRYPYRLLPYKVQKRTICTLTYPRPFPLSTSHRPPKLLSYPFPHFLIFSLLTSLPILHLSPHHPPSPVLLPSATITYPTSSCPSNPSLHFTPMPLITPLPTSIPILTPPFIPRSISPHNSPPRTHARI